MKRKGSLGPGVLIAAAFIGPGTVTTCTAAGVGFGYGLLWALLLSVIATGILQEMSARLGLVSRRGLADAVKTEVSWPLLKNVILGTILIAILVGNAAYEGGNIGGATLGLQALFGTTYSGFYPWCIAGLAFILLYFGNSKVLELVFTGLVFVMSLAFVITALLTKPDTWELLKGMFVPALPNDGILTVIALVGTTVVPYNLFLHASLVHQKWKSPAALKQVRVDTAIAIAVGGLVSMAIVLCGTAAKTGAVNGVMDMAEALVPLFGEGARWFIGIGLFAAGITSAITAPLAAAYVANSCFGWNADIKDFRFRSVWMGVLLIGAFFMSFDINPIKVIQLAQIANGLLLPSVAFFLLWAVNRNSLMGRYGNTMAQNVLGVLIVLVSIVLGLKSILAVFGIL
ncbi:Nramp family divalent metal transporter [Maribacter sp. 2-571]|uniref:Nramp family divalent metal transporter n=1 Tax=Maribacter sp. 2-571 TaxID=3417569 RepID=UPI003D3535BF